MANATYAANAVDYFFNSMGRFGLLEADEMIELSRKVQAWQQHPNGADNCPPIIKRIGIAARDKMVRHNLRLVVKIWRDNYRTRVGLNNAGLADLLQLGAQWLIRGAEKYDATRGHKFSTYAATWIHKGMKDYFSREERLVRMPANNYFLTRAAMTVQEIRKAKGLSAFTMDELCEELGKTRRSVPSPKTLAAWIEAFNKTNPVSFSLQVKASMGPTELGELIADSRTDADDEDDANERARQALDYLNAFERAVIEKRFFKQRNTVGHRVVAKALNSTEVEVRKAEQQAFKRIRLFVSR